MNPFMKFLKGYWKELLLIPVIFLAALHAYQIGEHMQWRFGETSEIAKPKSESQKFATKIESLEEKTETALENVKELSDTVDERFAQLGERVTQLDENAKKDRTILNGLSASQQPAEAEQGPTIELVPALPKEEWEEVKPKKKGDHIPNTTPKEPMPDLFARARKTTTRDDVPTHVLGSCGRAHAIVGWTPHQNRPIYGPCRDLAGNPACAFVKMGTMRWQ